MNRFVFSLCGMLPVLGPAAFGEVVAIPDYTSPTLAPNGSYVENHPLDQPVSGDPAVYLVSTVEFTNPNGVLASGTMWNQVGAFVPQERTSLGMPARSDKWGILGVGNNSSSTVIPIDVPTLLVMKIDQVAGQAWMWISPDFSAGEPDPESADVTVNNAGITADISQVTYRGGAYSGATNTNIVNYRDTKLYFGGETPFNVPQEMVLELSILPSTSVEGAFDFQWASRPGSSYDLVSTTDLSSPVETWAVWEGLEGIEATEPTNVLTAVSGGGAEKRFFAVVER